MSKKTRYTDAELQEFKTLIEEKIEKANADLLLLKSAYMNDGNNGTEDTAPTFKAFEEGSETMSKEANTPACHSPRKIHPRFEECLDSH
jgi:hypothetical protein